MTPVRKGLYDLLFKDDHVRIPLQPNGQIRPQRNPGY